MDNNQFNNQNQQYQNPYNQQPQQPVSPYQQPNQGYDNQQQYYQQPNQQPYQQYQDPSQQNYYQQPNPYTNPAEFVAQQEEKNAKNFAISSLVLSLVSFVVCFGIVCSILGLVFGIKSKKLKPENNGMATAGIILSIIALVLSVVFLIFNTYATVTLNLML